MWRYSMEIDIDQFLNIMKTALIAASVKTNGGADEVGKLDQYPEAGVEA